MTGEDTAEKVRPDFLGDVRDDFLCGSWWCMRIGETEWRSGCDDFAHSMV